jgi:hypothetical protein
VTSSNKANETICVDTDCPKKNGEFFIHHISDVSTGDELIDLVKITTAHLIDLRDFKHYSGHVVLNGQGFLISRPTVPHFLLYDYKALFEKEKKRCSRTEEMYKVEVNQIIASPARQVKSILLLFPDGMTCNADMGATTPSSIDQKVNLILRPLAIDTMVKKGSAMVVENQSFCPGYWVLRVINDNRRILNLEENEGEDDDLEKAFAGMNV